ncbi:MAG: hypothetical protein V4472_13005 [Pseudomonadota bacterium]
MARILTFLTCLAVFVSLGWGSLAHAMEPVGCIDTPTSALSGHVEGDRDEVPADGDKGYPHHHAGCQGHQVPTPFDRAPGFAHVSGKMPLGVAQLFELHGATTDPALRPPQA